MIFESHAHYDDARYDEDREALIKSLPEHGIQKVVNIGADMAGSFRSVELAKTYDHVYAAVGVHPHDVLNMKEDDLETLIELCAFDKVVAIGEIGLDYHYDNSPREIQKLWFREQLKLAKSLDLPAVIHSREATADTLELIKEAELSSANPGVIHCFSGSREVADIYIGMGFYIGVGGVVTYSNAKTLVEVVRHTPLAHIVVETDCPYLSPTPFRGQRNDSTKLPYIIKAIAQIKNLTPEEVEMTTYNNAMKLFFGN